MGISTSRSFPRPVRLDADKLDNSVLASYADLASAVTGGKVVTASDQFFGAADNLIKARLPKRHDDEYNENGLVVDGWVTTRHNKDNDWAVIKLGLTGTLIGFDIDTTHLEVDSAPRASVEACFVEEEALKKTGEVDFMWTNILPIFTLRPNAHNFFGLPDSPQAFNFVRLTIYPDGGVARFRCYGTVSPRLRGSVSNSLIDLASISLGGKILSVSCDPKGKVGNLLLPGRE